MLYASEVRESYKHLLKCPRCAGPVILHSDGVTCQKIDCGGIFHPKSMGLPEYINGCPLTLGKLREAFPELVSERKGLDET